LYFASPPEQPTCPAPTHLEYNGLGRSPTHPTTNLRWHNLE
jgi:hypothetical protein